MGENYTAVRILLIVHVVQSNRKTRHLGGVTPITETMSKYILIFPRIVANRKLKKYHPNSVNSQQQQEILQLLTFNYPEYEIWPTGIVTIVDV